ncbi:OLC1v1004886C1 [Oldenlandia corymbosa var. corymbosa]|uniref:OLC1v1004886C1 n=1 Tax=Oldenlandia corymbosa var. corymbosa TaxID=529605 RepID=A0AAV1DG25_OLDCO|nr:OLC1v1004886C1 [Oldenlandia corymbosa var. corymbosa]
MDPELFRIAQEQMSRMSPAELARIQQQMMSNPELLRMASEGMKSLRPEDIKTAAEQLKHTRPEEMAELSEKMANASPEEIAGLRARLDAQVTYEINAAQMLKKQGNQLHNQGNYEDALQKYLLAKNNLKGVPPSKGRALLSACSLNLMSCYLKTCQYDECIKEGSEVLAYDAENVKALYRRGQAYKALGQFELAVSDLTKAHEVSPDDEIIADVLRDAKENLVKEGGGRTHKGLVIEEITEDELTNSSASIRRSPVDSSFSKPKETTASCSVQADARVCPPSTNSEYLESLKTDPESIRSFQNLISQTDPETLAAMGNGQAEGISPDMIRTASNVIGKMSPEELQRMIKLASSFQGENPFLNRGSSDSSGNSFTPGSVPTNVSPDMLKMATDMMTKMSPEDIQRMTEMASSLRGGNGASSSAAAKAGSQDYPSKSRDSRDNFRVSDNDVGESTSGSQRLSSTRPSQSIPSSGADLQEQMRNQMKDPAMRQMLTSMMKNISPDMMKNMSEQFGLKLSQEDAERAQQAMSSLSPEDLDKMMRWADRLQRGVEGVKKTKNWLLGRQGMILAIVMLLLAVFLHWLGYIGK